MRSHRLTRWLAPLAAVAVAVLAAALVLRPVLTAAALVLALLATCALLAPRALLVAAIPATLLLDPVAGGVLGMALTAMLAGAWVVGLLLERWRLALPLHGALAALAGWLLSSYQLLSEDLTSELSRGHDLLTLLSGLVVCAVATSMRPSTRQIVAVTGASTVLVAVVALRAEETTVDRASALGLNFNFLAIVLSVGSVALVARYLATRNLLWLAGLVPSLLALSATRSRGGFISLAAGMAVLLLVGRRRRTQVVVGTAVAFAAAAVLIFPGVATDLRGAVVGRRTDVELSAYAEFRRQAAELAVHYLLEHPVTGIGYGLFPSAAERDPRLGIYINTHNEYLRCGAETGLIGLAILLALVAPTVGRLGADSSTRALLVAYLTALLFANTLSNLAVTMPFWLLLGLAWSGGPGRSPPTSSPVGVRNRAPLAPQPLPGNAWRSG